MSKHTKFNQDWKQQFSWLSSVSDIYSARCELCRKTFSVKNSGICQVKQHAATEKHVKNEKEMTNQRKFSMQGNLSKKSVQLTESDSVQRAELLQALSIIDRNQSFRSANGDSKRFQKMFHDSTIAQKYSQEETKTKYITQFGIAPCLTERLKKDIQQKPFCFKFDETTTSQIKKQYDAYVTYHSKDYDRITTSYCGSLFVGHCTSDDLLTHFYEFIQKLGLDVSYLLSIGMDGPNVNKCFENKLRNDLEESHKTKMLDLGTCALHAANNAFNEGLKVFRTHVNLDQFAIDLHFFFKYSAARREDLKHMSDLTETTTQYVLKHCQTRWLSLDKVLVRIIEQLPNLKKYFLEFLPTTPRFKGKSGIGQTERYQRIKSHLNHPELILLMSVVVNVAKDFKQFLVPLQSEEPKIHLLYSKCIYFSERFYG